MEIFPSEKMKMTMNTMKKTSIPTKKISKKTTMNMKSKKIQMDPSTTGQEITGQLNIRIKIVPYLIYGLT